MSRVDGNERRTDLRSTASAATAAPAGPTLADQLAALRRIALAVACPSTACDDALLHELLIELAAALPAAAAMVSVFADERRTTLRTLAARLDGRALPDFEYRVQGSPCERVVGGG